MFKRLIRCIFLMCAVFASAQVLAQNCASSGCDGKPPVVLPPMDIFGNPYPPGMAAGDRAAYDAAHRGGTNTQGAGQGGQGGGGNKPSWNGSFCRASLAALGGISCGLVVAACATGTFVTVGTLLIPCTGISVTACSVLTAGAIIGGEQLCKP